MCTSTDLFGIFFCFNFKFMLRKIYLDHFKIIVISVSKRETPTLLTLQPKPLSKLG